MSDNREHAEVRPELGAETAARLRVLFEAYGLDTARWPVADRPLARYCDAEMMRGVGLAETGAEARAVDLALAAVTSRDARTEALGDAAARRLADRIVAAAIAECAETVVTGADDHRVVPLRRSGAAAGRPAAVSGVAAQPSAALSAAGSAATPAQSVPMPAARTPGPRRVWRGEVAALLAASLLVGIYLGGQASRLSVVQDVANVVGLAADSETFQIGALDEQLGEEVL